MSREGSAIKIGALELSGNLVLAPMDGYTDWPFRSVCRELGSAISYTEFVKAEDVLDRPHYIQKKIQFSEDERPVTIQVYGHDPHVILAAALRLQEKEPDLIDLNLGCPNASIVRRGAGAGLLKEPKKVARILNLLDTHLELPVTAKIRLGWEKCQKQLLIARIVQSFGGSLLAVHAKTKEQGHQGPPDLDGLAEIVSALDIPVLGNGGITSPADIQTMLDASGCQGVMIGRAALENPWIFAGRRRSDVSLAEVRHLALDHLERSLSFYGKSDGLVLFRKFASSYLKPYQLEDDVRKGLLTEVEPARFKARIAEIFDRLSTTGTA